VRHLDAKDLIKGIRNNKGHQIELGHSTSLINNLETEFFKDKDKEEEVGVIDLINRIVQVLRGDLY
jgi:hypothetical protein